MVFFVQHFCRHLFWPQNITSGTCIITFRTYIITLLLPGLNYFAVTFPSRKLKQTEGNEPNRHNAQNARFLSWEVFISE